MDATKKYEERIYVANEVAWFRKTKEQYGGLSNMASGYPIMINGVHILSVEAFYQACRFPHIPDLQRRIINEKSPMSAKMVGKPFRHQSRPDWEEVKVKIMRWCLKVKLAQNFVEFGKVLMSTGNKAIVEDSRKDDFWGAIRDKENGNMLKGTNALGRLLMELRHKYYENRFSAEIFYLQPLNIPEFKLFGEPIKPVDERASRLAFLSAQLRADLLKPALSAHDNTVQENGLLVREKDIVLTESMENENTESGLPEISRMQIIVLDELAYTGESITFFQTNKFERFRGVKPVLITKRRQSLATQ